MSKSLNLIITFRKCLYDPVYVKEYARSFFDKLRENFVGEKATYKIIQKEPKSIDIDSVYSSDLYEMELFLEYQVEQDCGKLFFEIINYWCDSNINKLSNLWLRLAHPSILTNRGKLFHSDIEIKEIAFGTFPDMQHFIQHYQYDAMSGTKEIMATIMHSQRKLMIFTCLAHSQACRLKRLHNKIQFNYKSVSQVIVNYVPNTDFVQIFFHLLHTPFLFVKKAVNKGEENNHSVSFLASDQEYQAQTWDRTLDFGCSCSRSSCSLERIGKSPVFKIVIPKKSRIYSIIERLIQRCPSNTLFHFTSMKTVIYKYERYLAEFDIFPFNDAMLNLISDQNFKDDIIFKCQFAWEVLNSRSQVVRDQIYLKYALYDPNHDHWGDLKIKLRSIFSMMRRESKIKCYERINNITDALSAALFDISEMINKNLIFAFEDALKKLFEHHIKSRSNEEIPDGMCLVRRVVLTPSKFICLPPTEHFDNRVIRQFTPEYLLRVSIQDDNFQKLTFAIQYNSKRRDFLMRVMGGNLLKGIRIGPRWYNVLAASNSQLREHGLWMYAEDNEGNTAESIRQWMGDFHHIKNVAKYMARMGQCFSTSDESVQVELKEDEVKKLPDIELQTRDRRYIFSDGVGMISRDLAEEVRLALAQKNKLDNLDATEMYDPSAFQIRFKGCKGMLAESRNLRGRKIAIRDSMEKFPCPSMSVLEIVKISAPRAVYLNRPLITILENLGVEESVFLELQKKMVFDLTDSLIYEKKARKMLENCTSLDFPYRKLNNSGISLTQEPFFRSLLLSVYRSMIGNLKHKARILIPPKYGRNMMGVIDETRTLEYGQIFAQYSEKVGNILSPTKVLKGTVVVTKNPCMHPGDVRKLEAVDVPALHHIKDCVVFPAKGKRPHPDEMAGSDLDGDEYVLIWDPNLIFPDENCDAMDYPPNEEIILDRPIEVEDMVDFLCTYIQNDHIGVMANAYLAWADYDIDGIFSEVCKSIAKKYPQALDFAKSGTTQYLESNERPKLYPDFMEKGCQNNSYKSDRTLGLLYRVIRNLEASVSNIDSKVDVTPHSKLEYFGWETFKELAELRREQYTKRVKNILAKYGLRSEAEALTGYISEVNDCNRNKYDSENIVLLSKRYLIDTMKRYCLRFVKDCEEQRSKHPELPKKEIKYRMASAWYMVTYEKCDATILSFPWVVSDILCELRDQNRERGGRAPESLFVDSFDKYLLNTVRFQRNDECSCVLMLKDAITNWVKNSSLILTMSSEGFFCIGCVDRIMSNFKTNKMTCCSDDQNGCHCFQSCSPMKMILECFKYYASEVIPDIGTCQNGWNRPGSVCEGFRALNLQSLALKTYAVIAVTQSVQYLDIVNNTVDNNTESDIDEEGDPIRVRVEGEFKNILSGNVDDVCKILRDLSGVKQVFIDGSSDRKHFYLIVQSIGKAFNRWNLEEFIMDPKCPDILKSRLNYLSM